MQPAGTRPQLVASSTISSSASSEISNSIPCNRAATASVFPAANARVVVPIISFSQAFGPASCSTVNVANRPTDSGSNQNSTRSAVWAWQTPCLDGAIRHRSTDSLGRAWNPSDYDVFPAHVRRSVEAHKGTSRHEQDSAGVDRRKRTASVMLHQRRAPSSIVNNAF